MQTEKYKNIVNKVYDVLIFSLFSLLVFSWIFCEKDTFTILVTLSNPICFLLLIHSYAKDDVDSTKKSLLWFLLGFAMLLFFVYAQIGFVDKNVENVMISIAGSLISLGLVGVILQLKDTKDYFGEALSALVIKETYIEKLSRDQLKSLQKKILEKLFENNGELDRENSFYKFYNRKIESYIGRPYREKFHNTISISNYSSGIKNCEDETPGEDRYLVDDTVSYQCRSMGANLNTEVKWVASKDEIDSLTEFCVYLNKDKIFDLEDATRKGPIFLQAADKLSNKLSNGVIVKICEGFADCKNGVNLNLDFSEYKNELEFFAKDGCVVRVHAVYIATNFKTVAAKLLEPTKDYTLTVTHPLTLKSKVEAYGFEPNSKYYDHMEFTGGFVMSFGSWLLPESGVYIAFESLDAVDEKVDDLLIHKIA